MHEAPGQLRHNDHNCPGRNTYLGGLRRDDRLPRVVARRGERRLPLLPPRLSLPSVSGGTWSGPVAEGTPVFPRTEETGIEILTSIYISSKPEEITKNINDMEASENIIGMLAL